MVLFSPTAVLVTIPSHSTQIPHHVVHEFTHLTTSLRYFTPQRRTMPCLWSHHCPDDKRLRTFLGFRPRAFPALSRAHAKRGGVEAWWINKLALKNIDMNISLMVLIYALPTRRTGYRSLSSTREGITLRAPHIFSLARSLTVGE